MKPIKIFYCYAYQDRKLRDELEKQLMSLKRLGQITLRLNREILAGTNWSHVEDRRFQTADLILLLISSDFIHSDYHYGIEMHHALEKHEAGNVWVIPIILRPTALWEKTPIGRLQALPKDGKAITERRNREAAFVEVVKEISEVVAILLKRKQELVSASKAGQGIFPKFTRVIGPLCITCGARNPLGIITCENCGDLLLTNAAEISQKVHSHYQSDKAVRERYQKASGLLVPDAEFQQGRYIVTKFLGQGCTSTAALAKDTRVSSKLVVIQKMLSYNIDPEQQQADMRDFEMGVKILSEMDHPLIPKVTDCFQEEQHYYMVQEYVVGENLEKHMKRLDQPMLEREALAYISQVLDVLDYLSTQEPSIMPYDIKPSKIIIASEDKRAHLVDFDIASADKAEETKRNRPPTFGTLGFISPEHYQGKAEGRSNLYVLAAILHYLVTNRQPRNYPPFFYPSVRSLNSQLSPDIERLLDKALKVNVEERYQSPAEMKRGVDEILSLLAK